MGNFGRFRLKKRQLFWPVLWPRMVPVWSLGGSRWSPDASRGCLPGGFRAQKKCFRKLRKRRFFVTWHQEGWVLGVLPSIIVSNLTPKGDGLKRKVLQGENLAPFGSDKIRAKILDLGYGGARRALHKISPKSLLRFYQRQSPSRPCPPPSPQGLG